MEYKAILRIDREEIEDLQKLLNEQRYDSKSSSLLSYGLLSEHEVKFDNESIAILEVKHVNDDIAIYPVLIMPDEKEYYYNKEYNINNIFELASNKDKYIIEVVDK